MRQELNSSHDFGTDAAFCSGHADKALVTAEQDMKRRSEVLRCASLCLQAFEVQSKLGILTTSNAQRM